MVCRGTPARVRVKHNITQIAAGSNHTVLLTSSGHVITFGSYKVSLSFVLLTSLMVAQDLNSPFDCNKNSRV